MSKKKHIIYKPVPRKHFPLCGTTTKTPPGSDFCEVDLRTAPPPDLIHLDSSIKLSFEEMDSLAPRPKPEPTHVGSAKGRCLKFFRRVGNVMFGAYSQKPGYYDPFSTRNPLLRRLSMFTGVISPVWLGQVSNLLIRVGELQTKKESLWFRVLVHSRRGTTSLSTHDTLLFIHYDTSQSSSENPRATARDRNRVTCVVSEHANRHTTGSPVGELQLSES